MSELVNLVTYQGYPVKQVRWRRNDGLQADFGYVIVDYFHIKDLKLKSGPVPWVPQGGGQDVMGGLGIHDWWELFGKRPGTRAASNLAPEPSTGLNILGDLIFRTVGVDLVLYQGIYVANAEEVSVNLARAREHGEGEIRIDITDIRQFNGRYGTIIGRINCRMENGKYDPRTIKTPGKRLGARATGTAEERDGTPWSFEEVIRYLFSQLPGGPTVNLTGLGDLPPPEEIDHIGTPAASVIQDVLDNFGLIAKMQPNGSWFVARKNANFLKPGEVASAVNKVGFPPHISYEVKSASRVDTPALIMVLGKEKYRAQTLGYVPAFRDLDGRLYRLSDIEKVFEGYTLEQVNRQAAKTPGKHFQDVPPLPFKRKLTEAQLEAIAAGGRGAGGTKQGADQDALHYGRRRIMREQAYRVYAPAILFDGDAPTNEKGAPYFSDLDNRTFEFLPMGQVPIFESELKKQVPGARPVAGDKGRLVLAPPIVRGVTLGEALYTNRAEIERMHDGVIRQWDVARFDNEIRVQSVTYRIQHLDEEALRADRQAAVGEFIESGLTERAGLGTGANRAFLQRARSSKKSVEIQKLGLQIELEVMEKRVETFKKLVKYHELQKAEDLARLEIYGGLQGVGQIPFGVIPDNAYSLDSSTGILTFDQVSCVVDHLVVLDQEDLTVLGDGMVSVTFGHPIYNNETSDHTIVLFCRDGRNGSKLCGVSRPSAFAPYVVRAPDITLYEDEIAQPMNLKDVIAQAEKKAKPILDGADSTTGHVTQFSGFVSAVLERGVTSIQFAWDGGVAHTFVAIHSPGWVGPAGGGGANPVGA